MDVTTPAAQKRLAAAAGTAWLHARLAQLRRRWWLLAAGMVSGLLIAIAYLSLATYFYTGEIRVYAAPSATGVRPSSGLGGLAALAGIGGGGGNDAVPPFRYFLEAIYAPEVAAALARDETLLQRIFGNQWDAQSQSWHEPHSLLRSLSQGLNGALGRPAKPWHKPGAVELQAYIADKVTVIQNVRSPLAVIRFDFPDPAFAGEFVTRLAIETDGWMRGQQAIRSSANIDYLDAALLTAGPIDQREALIRALAEQEQRAMFTAGTSPFAAERFGRANVGTEPSRPKPVTLLIAATVAGLVLGMALALLSLPKWRRDGGLVD